MDRVFIDGLQIETVIGVYDWERSIRQLLIFDVELFCDTRAAGKAEDLSATVDYHKVVKRLSSYVSEGRFELVETVAERCAAILLNEFSVSRVRLRIAKPGAIEAARAVGVEITRESTAD